MAKNINVESHVNRYLDTDLTDIVKLIDGLTALLETQKVRNIERLEKQLSALKKGEMPEEEPTPEPKTPKRTRGGKKVAEPTTDDL